MTAKQLTPLERIRSMRGMASKIARELEIGLPSVSKWQKIPAERVVQLEHITGIPREELRPDLYRRPQPKRVKK